MEIAAKLADALSMFWQALDERERKLLLIAVVWIVAAVALRPVQQRKANEERQRLAAEVAGLLEARHGSA